MVPNCKEPVDSPSSNRGATVEAEFDTRRTQLGASQTLRYFSHFRLGFLHVAAEA
jgi:hypothetical protein